MSSLTVSCSLLQPTNYVAQYLRRYAGDFGVCPELGYHNSKVRIWDEEIVLTERGTIDVGGDDFDHNHPAWPVDCVCGYEFSSTDNWQLFKQRIYVNPVDKELYTLATAPIGSMWYADWMPDRWRGPDGHTLMVKTPGGDWCIDGPSAGGGKWVRTGEVPLITVSPSILIGAFHAWLRDGVLVEI